MGRSSWCKIHTFPTEMTNVLPFLVHFDLGEVVVKPSFVVKEMPNSKQGEKLSNGDEIVYLILNLLFNFILRLCTQVHSRNL